MQLHEMANRCVCDKMQLQEVTNTIVLNLRRTAEVPCNLRETQCSFRVMLFRNGDRQFVFMLFDVYGFPLFKTELFKPFAFKPDFGDRYHPVAAFLIGCIDLKSS